MVSLQLVFVHILDIFMLSLKPCHSRPSSVAIRTQGHFLPDQTAHNQEPQ